MPLIPLFWLVGGSLSLGGIAGFFTGTGAKNTADNALGEVKSLVPWVVAGTLFYIVIKKKL